jgi:hydroxymethylbilane synthase
VSSSKTIKIGSRATDFARAQTGKALERLHAAARAAKLEIEEIADSSSPNALLDALAAGRIQMVVEAARELPTSLPPGVVLTACTERNDPFDVLLSQGGQLLEDLADGATVAAESARVVVQLGRFREDLKMRKFDGTVDRLLPLLERGEVAGIVVAAEDVETLGWEGLVSEVFPPDIVLPAAGQGSFAILTREGDDRAAHAAQALDHELTRQIVLAERAFLRELGVEQTDPVAVHGRVEDGVILLEGMLGDAASGAVLRDELDGDPSEGEDLGVRLAKLFMADGAVDYLTSYK